MVGADFVEAVGPVPGGRWGTDIAWLKKKIAEAEAEAVAGEQLDHDIHTLF